MSSSAGGERLGGRKRERKRVQFSATRVFYTTLSVVSVALFLLAWEYFGRTVDNGDLLFSTPSAVWEVARMEVVNPEFWSHMKVSAQEFGVGYGLAAAMGIAFGVLSGWYGSARAITAPFVSVLYSTPNVALTPLLIVWFGLGLNSKVALVFLGAIFPIVLNLQSGIRNLDIEQVRAARSFGASDWQLFRTVAMPASVPFLIGGLRLAVGRALVGIVVGELVASQAGIGFYIAQAGATFQTDKLMFGVAVIAVVGVLSLGLLGSLEKRFQAWKPSSNA